MIQLQRIKEKWIFENIELPSTAKDEELLVFESEKNVHLPYDFKQYFKELNGTNGEYDKDFFQFYSLFEIKKINEEYIDWLGIPDYKRIVYSLDEFEQYYAFANYTCHSFCYAIKLNREDAINEVLVICGGEYKKIANSFSEFIDLYLAQSIELQLNKEK